MRFRRLKQGKYAGAVVFVDGSHYPAPDGHPDKRQRVLWDAETETYNWAKPEDPTHAGLYEMRPVEIPIAPSEQRYE